ncbi:hypothetical protein ACG7TL_004032 [Trametes sanguinea]
MLEDPYLWITKPGAASEAQARLLELQRQLSTRDALQKLLEKLKERAGRELQYVRRFRIKSSRMTIAAAQGVGDPDIQRAVLLEVKGLQHSTAEYLRSLWLSDPIEQGSAFIEIRAGSPNAEACDWAAMIARMYTEWANARNYAGNAPIVASRLRIVNQVPGDTAGVKSVTLLVEGPYAYGFAQYESGVHSLQRASSSDEAGAGMTSTASVRVLPYIEEDGSSTGIEIYTTDLEVAVANGRSASDQRVDDSEGRNVVHVVHVPTGIEATVSSAEKFILGRNLMLVTVAQSAADAQEMLPAHSWDSEIRSYALQPHPLVKDLRTEFVARSNAAQKVLDGDLQEIMEASLRKFKKKV